MTDLNFTVLTGRLSSDFTVLNDEGGRTFGFFSLVYNTRKKTGEIYTDKANYITCILPERICISLKDYLSKGVKVQVAGNLQMEHSLSVTNKKTYESQLLVSQNPGLGIRILSKNKKSSETGETSL